MEFLWTARARLRALFRGDSLEQDMDREMRAHLELLSAEYEASGMPPADARMAALRRFGNTTVLKERGRDVRGAGLIGEVLRDVRYALRGVRRAPRFSAVVVLILALGIGANAAIFSIVDALILDELPYPNGEQLVAVYETRSSSNSYNVATPENWVAWLQESRSFDSLAAWSYARATLTRAGEPVALTGQLVSAEFFPLLGVEPMLGRAFTPEEDRPNAPRVVILSHGLWRSRFGSNSDVVGQTIELNPAFGGQPGSNEYEIIGVMPERFSFVSASGPADVDYWMPFALERAGASPDHFINVLGRLRPGVTPTAAQTEMATLNRQLVDERGYGEEWSVNVAPLQSDRVRDVRTSLLLLFGAVGALVLLACLNVAGLLLARGVRRRGEMAIRRSLGAGRAAIVRQMLTEGLVLALCGAGLGLLVFRWMVDGLLALAPTSVLKTVDLDLGGRVLLYVLGLSVVTAIVCTLAPALTSGRESWTRLAATTRTVTQTTRLRQGMAIAQVAIALILASGAGHLARTLQELLGGDNGLNVENVLSLPVSLPVTDYDRSAQIAFFREAVERLDALPGVDSAGAGRTLPITGVAFTRPFHVAGTPELPAAGQTAKTEDVATVRVREVTPGYFRTLGVPIRQGRDFSTEDRRSGAPPVFVVNEAFARRYFPSSHPIDADLSLSSAVSLSDASILTGRIVGIVGDVKEGSLRRNAEPVVFVDYDHMTFAAMTLFLRAGRPQGLSQAAAQVIREMDPDLPVTTAWLEDVFAESVARDRMNATVLGAFAVTALVLAAFGVYGLLVYIVAERTREIGIRMALGARPKGVVLYVAGQGTRLVIPGVVLGLLGALAFSRSLNSLLYGVAPYDMATFVPVVTLVLAVGTIAVIGPACRAAGVDPLVALKEE